MLVGLGAHYAETRDQYGFDLKRYHLCLADEWNHREEMQEVVGALQNSWGAVQKVRFALMELQSLVLMPGGHREEMRHSAGAGAGAVSVVEPSC